MTPDHVHRGGGGAEDLPSASSIALVGVVTEVCPHPNADKLRICRTDIGGGDIREIVCGGTNLTPGCGWPACPGALCRWHGEGEPVEIKESKLRGVKSYGMICAASEIGLGDLFPTDEEAHILDLSAFDAPAGTLHCRCAGPSRHHSGDRQQVYDQPA